MLIKEFTSKSAVIDTEKRQIRFLASTPDIDRDGERILPTALEKSLPGFMQNPVFLACHQHRLDGGEPPVIGKITRSWTDAAGLWAIVQFAESELAEKYWQLYRDGFMSAVSVGFIPIKQHEEFIEGKRVTTYDEVEWIELSGCAVPANRNALSKSKQRKADFVAAKIAQRKAQADVIDEDDVSAFGLIGYARRDFSEDELAEFSEEELAVLDLCELSGEAEAEPEPDYGSIIKSGPSSEFYNE